MRGGDNYGWHPAQTCLLRLVLRRPFKPRPTPECAAYCLQESKQDIDIHPPGPVFPGFNYDAGLAQDANPKLFCVDLERRHGTIRLAMSVALVPNYIERLFESLVHLL
jgi:hypothetical protein